MKKLKVVALSISLTVFIVAVSLIIGLEAVRWSEMTPSRHNTLKLSGVSQTYDSIVLDIDNADVIEEDDCLEISFDGGKNWERAYLSYQNKYYCNFIAPQFGKEYKITVRIAEDIDNRASKKSNTIKYKAKRSCGFDENLNFGMTLSDYIESMLDGEIKEYFDEYVFAYQDGSIRLRKFYAIAEQIPQILPVEDNDKLNFEYALFDMGVISNKYEDRLTEQNEEQSDFVKMLSAFAYVIDHNNDSDLQWKDYDYLNGISQEEFSKSVIKDFDVLKDEIGEQAILCVRVKESDTVTSSSIFTVRVPLR